MDKTAVVQVERLYVHSKYRKILRHRKKYFAHDEHNICGVGDRVQIRYTGKSSKKKNWSVIDMLTRQPRLEGEPFPRAALHPSPEDSEANVEPRMHVDSLHVESESERP